MTTAKQVWSDNPINVLLTPQQARFDDWPKTEVKGFA